MVTASKTRRQGIAWRRFKSLRNLKDGVFRFMKHTHDGLHLALTVTRVGRSRLSGHGRTLKATAGPAKQMLLWLMASLGASVYAPANRRFFIVLYQLLWPSRALWSEEEKTNFVASKMPIPIGVDIEVRYGTRRRVPLRGASQISVSC
jgi:hypothetical protein